MRPVSGTGSDIVDQIDELLRRAGFGRGDRTAAEPVSALHHALQCAWLAERAGAPDALVAAALLHDLGQLIPPGPSSDAIDDVHELRVLGLLTPAFDRSVIEPVRLHVQAKRYLVATDPYYHEVLSPASAYSLSLQGGPMSADECRWFEDLPFADDALALRRWDDEAKEPGRRTPPLAHYIDLLHDVKRMTDRPRPPSFSKQALVESR